MARQGLMDDAGYDFFDVSDCANYESCREDAYKDGYEKGRADAFNEILNEMRKSPFASDKATFVKKYIDEQLKEQNE